MPATYPVEIGGLCPCTAECVSAPSSPRSIRCARTRRWPSSATSSWCSGWTSWATTRPGSASTTRPASRSSPAPELFIATAAERTKHIRLGTGVSSLPYHHPLMLADRINQLDHMTRGRVMFGVGPGALPSDAIMMGIRRRQAARHDGRGAGRAWCACCAARRSPTKTDWFTLNKARLQMTPYSRPSVEIAVASQVSPTGARAAGKHGVGLLSIGATSAGGFNALASNWAIAEQMARDNGTRRCDRARWRLVGPMHIAETQGKGAARTCASACESGCSISARWWRCRWRRPTCRPGRLADRVRHGGGRHAGRRDRRRSTGCRSSPAASAASCSWRTTGRIGRTPSTPTSCSPAT